MDGTEPLRIVIADDHAVVREGLRLLLESEADIQIAGEAGDLARTRELLAREQPDLLLLDLHMGRELSLTALPSLRGASPRTAVVVLTMQDDPAFATQMLEAGAAGYVLKEASHSELMRALRMVARGGTYLDPSVGVLAVTAGATAAPALSERETDVLRLIALGHTNSEIAKSLHLSVRTVETHRANLQRKLGVSTRPELVRYALQRRVIKA